MVLYFSYILKIQFPLRNKTNHRKDFERDTIGPETRDKSNDILINGYIESKFLSIESTWVELNLFGRYKVRENSFM